ncbi:DgyrCDS4407 [Dimorphilus gyrociliatus]|uniref:DgyrCDS4407 n=1 Tax=Dimorphilus gyrociliatus TaxID=2664684 RepID=A0A7I8VGK4_9ANNE|nr:DgyrCDS4407 [Dimorphilus gyrociliatus]
MGQPNVLPADNERKVIVPPLIYIQPKSNLTFVLGESIEMPCVATGVPEPRYNWTFNNVSYDASGVNGKVAKQPGKGTLIFADPQQRDEGTYQCFAYNEGGVCMSIKIYLRMAILDSFVSRKVTVLEPRLGDSLKLTCTPPRAYPEPDIFWAILEERGSFYPIEEDDRITMDPDGNLYITNVAARDKQSGKRWACVVQNRLMREIRHGEYKVIEPISGLPQLGSPTILYSHPTTQVAVRGETWKVKCIFGGNPTPNIDWIRGEGKPIPKSAKIESYSQQLTIYDIREEDAGSYQCSAMNSNSPQPQRQSFNLKVEAAPYWIHKPMSQDVADNERVEFLCEGQGKPDVEYYWFINERKLGDAPPDPKRTKLKTKMIFTNVTKHDVKVIACNVTNAHGYIFASAYLNVQLEPPHIRRAPKIGMKAAEGQTIDLTCEVYGSPKPLVIWYKGQEQLTGGRFEILPEGHLRITDVSLVDTGTYRCFASNRLGTASAEGTLIVRRKTMIRIAPQDVTVYEGTEAKFTCTATTDSEEIQNLRIRWKKDNAYIDFSEAQRIFQNSMDNSLTISGTISLDTSKYSCVAENGLDSDEKTAQLVVQNRPDPPKNVHVKCKSDAQQLKENQVEVTWEPRKENYAPILNFILQYNTSFTPDNWVDYETNINQTQDNIKVFLTPWSNFTFRVLARNKIGISEPSTHSSETCLTEEDVPSKNPDNVIGEGDAPRNLVIFWTPMPQIEHHAPNFKYIIEFRRADISNSKIERKTVEDWWENHYRAGDNLPSYTPYNITIRAVNRIGPCPIDPTTVVGYTGEEQPTIVVGAITVSEDSITDFTAQLQWQQVDTNPDLIKGFFRGYKVQFWKEGEKEKTMREQDFILREPENPIQPRIRGQQLSRKKRDLESVVKATLTHLPANSRIIARALVLNRYFASAPSPEVSFQTKPGKPGPPSTFNIVNRGATHFELRWTKPREVNGELVGYDISYQIVKDLNLGRLQFREQVSDPDANYARLTGLRPETNYRIYLYAVTKAGRGEPIFLDMTTIPASRPYPPTFSITAVGRTFVNLTFEPSRIGNPGSVFYPQYRIRGFYHWTHAPDEVIDFNAYIGDLEPGTTYQIRMMSKNGETFESASEFQELRTDGTREGKASASQGWHIGLWIGLILVIAIFIGFIVGKKRTDEWWKDKEEAIDDEIRALQSRQAAEHLNMGLTNQYVEGVSRDYDDYSAAEYRGDQYPPETPVSEYAPTYNYGQAAKVHQVEDPQEKSSTFFSLLVCFVIIVHGEVQPPAADNERKVIVPPLIYLQPDKNLTFVIGESVEMPCVASGVPEPKYRWEFNDRPYDPSGVGGNVAIQPGKGTLIFAKPETRDEGIYQCFAENEGGTSISIKVYMRRAILHAFDSKLPRTLYPRLGAPLKLSCTPPRSYPKADIFWALVSENDFFVPIELTQRITMDPDGNLYITAVEEGDKQNGLIWACMVKNELMRETRQGEYKKVQPLTGQVQLGSPTVLYHHPRTQIALRGETWKIKCIFGGNPTPHINWHRANEPLPDRHKLESFGQELVINDIRESDNGVYQCSGINSNSIRPERFSFDLKVEAAPYWVNKPISQEIAENERAEFLCLGNGKPDVEYFWFINDKKLVDAPANPNRFVSKNKMIFTNVTKDDIQVIACNVTNTHGYVFASAYLNVQVEPPHIRRAPKIGMKSAEGQTIDLTCEVYGSPKPLVIWYKGQEQLTGGRFEILPEGHLRIIDVSLVDAGSYRCYAENNLGNTTAEGTLIVRRKTMIRIAPQDVAVYEGTEAKFTCSANTDSEEVKNLRIRWKKDNAFIDFEEAQRLFQNTMDNSLTISGTISLDTSKYTCVADNGLDSDEKSAQLVVQGRPEPPTEVSVICRSSTQELEENQVKISWQARKENYAPILNYIVQYNTSFTPDNWANIETNISQTQDNIKVFLSPWSNYTFRVLARNKIGISEPSMHSREMCFIEEDIPDKNPDNVLGEGDAPRNLIIFWTPMPQIEHNAPNFKYVVEFQRADIANSKVYRYNVEDWWENHFRAGDELPSYTPYNITVRAVNRKGPCEKQPAIVTGYTGEERPTVQVGTITIDESSITDSTAELQWKQVDTRPEVIRGFFRGYRIQFWQEGSMEDTIREQDFILREGESRVQPRIRTQFVSRSKRSLKSEVKAKLTHLLPNSKIVCRVLVLNRYYAGDPSSEVTFNTKPGKPGPPSTFNIANRGSTHIELRWTKPREVNGELVGYDISYQIVKDLNLGRLQFREQVSDPEANFVRLTGLRPETNYRIYLYAVTKAGRGEPIFLDMTTIPASRPYPPTFSIMAVGRTFVNLTFEPSRIGNPGSVFYPQYRIRGFYHWTHAPDEVIDFNAYIGDLEPGTTYQIRMMSKNGETFESASEYQEFRTDGTREGKASVSHGWHIGLWLGLIAIVALLVAFVIVKKKTDVWWTKKEGEIDDEIRALQSRQAAEQLNEGLGNQYSEGASRDYDDYSISEYKGDQYEYPPETPVSGYAPSYDFDQPPNTQQNQESEKKGSTFV